MIEVVKCIIVLNPMAFCQILSQLFELKNIIMNKKPWFEANIWPLIQQKKTLTMYH